MGIFSERQKENQKKESPIITAFRNAQDSKAFAIALLNFHNANDARLCTADHLDLLLDKSHLCDDCDSVSKFALAIKFFCKTPQGREIASCRARVRDVLFDFVLRFCDSSDLVTTFCQPLTELTYDNANSVHLLSVSEARRVFTILASHSKTPQSNRILFLWMHNCCLNKEGKLVFGHPEVVDAIMSCLEFCSTQFELRWLFTSLTNLCTLSETRQHFLRDDVIAKIFPLIHKLDVDTALKTDDDLRLVTSFFEMMNNFTFSEEGQILLNKKQHVTALHNAILHLSPAIKKDRAIRGLFQTIGNLTMAMEKDINSESRILFSSTAFVQLFCRCAPLIKDIKCVGWFGRAINDLNLRTTDEVRKRFAIPDMLKAILTLAQIVYAEGDTKKEEADSESSEKSLAVRWLNGAVCNISLLKPEGKQLFACDEFADCWSKLVKFVKTRESARISSKALQNVGALTERASVFATDPVIQGIELICYQFVQDEVDADAFAKAVGNLTLDAKFRKVFSRPSIVDAFVRVAKHVSTPETVSLLCSAISRCCKNGESEREVFSCAKIIQEFVVVVAPSATTASSAKTVFANIADTSTTTKGRGVYQELKGVFVDVFYKLGPACTSPGSATDFCIAVSNLCIEEDLRKLFDENKMIDNYKSFAKYLAEAKTAIRWAKSLKRLINGRQESFSKEVSLKNALCLSVFLRNSAFARDSESAVYFVALVDMLFENKSNNDDENTCSTFCTTSFKQAFDRVAKIVLDAVDGHHQHRTKIERCRSVFEKYGKELTKDDNEVVDLIAKTEVFDEQSQPLPTKNREVQKNEAPSTFASWLMFWSK